MRAVDLKKTGIAVLFLAIFAAAVGIFYGYFYKNHTAIAQEHNSLSATGTIEARSVLASFKVPGRIEKLFVDEGSKVEEGQELACLEDDEIAAQLMQAQGNYAGALGQASEAGEAITLTGRTVEAKIRQAEAALAKAESDFNYAKEQYDRMKYLHDNGAIPDSTFDDITNKYQAAQEGLKAAQAQLAEALAAKKNVDLARSKYEAALGMSQAAAGKVREAETYLRNTRLKAPISGYITQKLLEAGEMAGAGTPVFEITDLAHTYVKVYIDEKKIGRVHLNQAAEVRVDSFPGRVFKGKVVWINDAGEFAVRKAVNEQYDHDIRSFEVKIDVPNPGLVLKTGMTARVRILEEGR
ncbi:MAG TPA: HlyD family secretion protein [Syntrophomonadaceae bacterium]|nr:HlyD family secretion protein [Syntrophomonadaceae bacterium]